MPEIGATLREARMRAHIDISEIEAETKIRAKYLRALENEEWDLLPGPTFVKSFLRTYAEALDIDAKLLVEEYKLRHEGLSGDELARPIGPPRARRGATPPSIPRGYVIAGLVLALIAVLYLLGTVAGDSGDDHKDKTSTSGSPTTTQSRPSTQSSTPAATKPPAPKLVRLRVVATGEVNVCLAGKGQPKPLVNGINLTAGQETKTFRSSRFRMVLGNNNVKLRIDDKTVTLAPSSKAIGLQITAKGRSKLFTPHWPACTG